MAKEPDAPQEDGGGFLSFNLNDAKILTTVPPGEEYKLLIEAAEMKTSQKSGATYINCRASIVGHPESKAVFFPIFGVEADADDGQRARRESQLKEFCLAIGYDDPDGIHPDKLVGKEGYNVLGEEEYNGELINRVGRWVYSTADEEGGGF